MIEEELYRLYPRHIGKRAAITAIRKAIYRLPDELHENELDFDGDGSKTAINPFIFLKEKVIAFAKSPAGKRGLLTPHPSTWFNQARYLDDPQEWQYRDKNDAPEMPEPLTPADQDCVKCGGTGIRASYSTPGKFVHCDCQYQVEANSGVWRPN